MNKKLIYIDIVLIIILLIVGYKSYNMDKYHTDKVNISLGEEIIINKSEKETNLTQGNLNFYLDLDEYKIDETGTIYSKDEDKNTYIKFSEINDIIQNTCRYDHVLNTIDYIDIMNKNDLKNEKDILNYYYNHQNDNLNIITSMNRIKTDYFTTIFVKTLNINGTINYFKGLDGFKYNNLIYIFNNGNLYKIEFSTNLKNDDVLEVLNTINFY